MADLSGRVAVVTGAGRGLGRGIAEGLAEAGAIVYVTGRTSSDADVRRLFERVQAEQGRLDVLVNHLQPERALARDCALAIMAAQDHGLVIELASAAAPLPAVGGGITVLQLAPCRDKPRYSGRCVAALAMDPDIAEKSGGSFRVSELAREYRFSDPADPVPGARPG